MSDLCGGSTNLERGQAAYLRKKYMLRDSKYGLILLYYLNDIIHHNTDAPYFEGIEITDSMLRQLHRSLKGSAPLIGPNTVTQFKTFSELAQSQFFPQAGEARFTKEFLLNESSYSSFAINPDWPPETGGEALQRLFPSLERPKSNGGATVQQRGQAAYLREKYYLRDSSLHIVILYLLSSLVKRADRDAFPAYIILTEEFIQSIISREQSKHPFEESFHYQEPSELLGRFTFASEARRPEGGSRSSEAQGEARISIRDLLSESNYLRGGLFADFRELGCTVKQTWGGTGRSAGNGEEARIAPSEKFTSQLASLKARLKIEYPSLPTVAVRQSDPETTENLNCPEVAIEAKYLFQETETNKFKNPKQRLYFRVQNGIVEMKMENKLAWGKSSYEWARNEKFQYLAEDICRMSGILPSNESDEDLIAKVNSDLVTLIAQARAGGGAGSGASESRDEQGYDSDPDDSIKIAKFIALVEQQTASSAKAAQELEDSETLQVELPWEVPEYFNASPVFDEEGLQISLEPLTQEEIQISGVESVLAEETEEEKRRKRIASERQRALQREIQKQEEDEENLRLAMDEVRASRQ
jgi:hypothetical protein